MAANNLDIGMPVVPSILFWIACEENIHIKVVNKIGKKIRLSEFNAD